MVGSRYTRRSGLDIVVLWAAVLLARTLIMRGD